MADQLALPWAVDPTRVYELARCAFGQPTRQNGHAPGWDGPDHCAGCAAESDRLGAAFEALVADGHFDAAGYSLKERKAQARRRARESTLTVDAVTAVGGDAPVCPRA